MANDSGCLVEQTDCDEQPIVDSDNCVASPDIACPVDIAMDCSDNAYNSSA